MIFEGYPAVSDANISTRGEPYDKPKIPVGSKFAGYETNENQVEALI